MTKVPGLKLGQDKMAEELAALAVKLTGGELSAAAAVLNGAVVFLCMQALGKSDGLSLAAVGFVSVAERCREEIEPNG